MPQLGCRVPETKCALEGRLRAVRRLPPLEQLLAQAAAELDAAETRAAPCRWSDEAELCRRLSEEASRRQAALAALGEADAAAPDLQRRLAEARDGWRRLQTRLAERARLVQVSTPPADGRARLVQVSTPPAGRADPTGSGEHTTGGRVG